MATNVKSGWRVQGGRNTSAKAISLSGTGSTERRIKINVL